MTAVRMIAHSPHEATHCRQCGAQVREQYRENYARVVSCEQCKKHDTHNRQMRWRKANPEAHRATKKRQGMSRAQRAAQRAGRVYQARDRTGRRKLIREETQALCRIRGRRWPTMRLLVARLLHDEPQAIELSRTTRNYRARYRYDATFRSREIARRHASEIAPKSPDDGTLTKQVVARLFAATRDCPYCGRRMCSRDKSLDHLIPRSRGGEHGLVNVAVCCLQCNLKKARRTALEFMCGLSRCRI